MWKNVSQTRSKYTAMIHVIIHYYLLIIQIIGKLYAKLYVCNLTFTCASVLVPILIRVLKLLKFSNDFWWYDKELKTFRPRYLKFFVPNLTQFDLPISRFSFSFSRVELFAIFSFKLCFTRLGSISITVFKNSIHQVW